MTRTSISDNGSYPAFCKQAAHDSDVFATFRRNPAYLSILEHVSEGLGTEYLKHTSPDILANADKYITSDLVGDPMRFEYPIGLFSPTTLRYMKVASDLKVLFGDLSGMRIVEVGCGYGGLCKVLMDTFEITEYTLIDLDPVLFLAGRFLNETNVPPSKLHLLPPRYTFPGKYDLFISNYALTECQRREQETYIRRLQADRGYITANFINHHFGIEQVSLEELIAMLPPLEVRDEVPNTNPDNRILVWGHE